MTTPTRVAFVTLVLAMLAAPGEARPRFGVEAWGSWNGHGMSDVNDTLRSFNAEFQTGLPLIRNGAGGGFGVRLWPREDIVVRLGLERLMPRSRHSGVVFDLDGYAVTLGGARFQSPAKGLHLGVGLGLCAVFADGTFEAPGASLDISGTGFGGQVTGEGQIPMGDTWSFGVMAGHRWATVRDLKFGERRSDLDADYSGFFLRVGVAMDGESGD